MLCYNLVKVSKTERHLRQKSAVSVMSALIDHGQRLFKMVVVRHINSSRLI